MSDRPFPAEHAPELGRPRIRWTFALGADLAHLTMARETARVFLADRAYNLYSLSPAGRLAGPQALPDLPLALEASADGACLAVLCEGGLVCLFDAALQPLTVRSAGPAARVLAVDAFADRFVILDDSGRAQVMDRYDRRLAAFQVDLPLHQLRLIDSRSLVLGLSDRRQMLAIGLDGQVQWSCSLECPVARFDADHQADMILVASLDRGVTRCNPEGQVVGSYLLDGAITHVAVSWDGSLFLAGNTAGGVFLVDRVGRVRWTHAMDGPCGGVGIDALGRRAVCATAAGQVALVDLYATEPIAAPRTISLPPPAPPPPAVSTPRVLWQAKLAGKPAKRAPLRLAEGGRLVALTTRDGRVRLVEASGKRLPYDPRLEPDEYLMLDPQARRLWVVGSRELRCLDLATGSTTRMSLAPMASRPAHLTRDGTRLVTTDGPLVIACLVNTGQVAWRWRAPGPIGHLALADDGRVLGADASGRWWVLGPDGSPRQQSPTAQAGLVAAAAIGNAFCLLLKDGRSRLIGSDGRLLEGEALGFRPRGMVAAGRALFVAGRSALVVLDESGRVQARGPGVESPSDVYCAAVGGPGVVTASGTTLMGCTVDGQRRWLWESPGVIVALACSRDGAAVACTDGQIGSLLRVPAEDTGAGGADAGAGASGRP